MGGSGHVAELAPAPVLAPAGRPPYRAGEELIDPASTVTAWRAVACPYPTARLQADGHGMALVEATFPRGHARDGPGAWTVASRGGVSMDIDTFGPALKGAWLHVAWRVGRGVDRPVLAGYVVLLPADGGGAALRFDGTWRNRRPHHLPMSAPKGYRRLREEPVRLLERLAAVFAAPPGSPRS